MYVQPLDGSLGANSLGSLGGNAEGEGALFAGTAAPQAGDNISRFVPPWLSDGAAASQNAEASSNAPSLQGLLGPLMGVLQQLMQMLQSLMGYGGGSGACPPYGNNGTCPPYGGNGACPPYGNNGTCQPYGNERFFQNADGSSHGDPHLSFNGSKWTSMASQPDLLNSDSIPGGYRISTQATPENAKGVSWNRSATIALNNGATTISMNNNGRASITNNGQSLSIAPGQTLGLGNGESVTCEQNGTLRVTAQNGSGGQITTTLTAKNNGVDVGVTAHDVDLGGALVNGPGSNPLPGPISGPIPGPIQEPVSGPILAPWNGSATDPFAFPPSNVAEPAAFPDY
jgi:hypothetical protein